MAKYRKKPVVIDAVRIPLGSRLEHLNVLALFYASHFEAFTLAEDLGYDITTLEGVMHANPGDWIIKGVKGEFYGCKNDVFVLTYEPVDA